MFYLVLFGAINEQFADIATPVTSSKMVGEEDGTHVVWFRTYGHVAFLT